MAKIDDKKLEAIVSQQIALAKSHDTRERQAGRDKAIDYFLGAMGKYVPPEENRSKAVSRDVADTVGWMLPGIIRVFTASDRMAEAEPVEEDDIEFARQATDGINYVFWKENKGYEIVYAATWDSLVTGNGVVKTFYDDTPIYATSFHSGLTEDQRALLLMPNDNGEEPEILAETERTMLVPDEMGQPMQVPVYDLKIRRIKASGRFVVEVVPPEHFLVDGDAIYTDEAAFCAHWERKTRSELVGMGYDAKEVASVPVAARASTSEEAARGVEGQEDAADASMELVDYYECYIRIDVDGDGEAELLRVCFAGSDSGKMLDWEVWEDDHPFDDIPCTPVPHRWVAQSIADETMDVQDIKTVLLRQALNNTYAANNPQRFATGHIENPDQLVSPTFGGVVFGKAGAAIIDLPVPFVANHAFEAIAYQDEVIQRRTGVGRGSMALDPQALQNQTAEAVREGKDAGYSQIELIARNQAEWGWRKVFRKLLRLMVKHQDYSRRVVWNGKPVDIDPRHWNVDMDVTINVGLGTGSRDRDLSMLSQILQTQLMMADRFMAAGATEDAIDMLPKILRTMVKMAESAGIRNPEDFYPEYTEERVAQLKQLAQQKAQQGDPKAAADMAKAKADMEIKQQSATLDAQMAQQKMMADQAAFASEMQLKRDQQNAEMQLKREQLAAEIDLKWRQFNAELALKRELGMANVSVNSGGVTSGVHMGGEPG